MTIKKLIISKIPTSLIAKLKSIYYFRYTFNKFITEKNFHRLKPREIYNREIKHFDLLIYDSVFPNLISGFRFAEFNALLNIFKNAKIIVNPTDYKHLNQKVETHKTDIELLKKTHPISYKKTFVGTVKDIKNTNLFYCIFLNNIYSSLPYLEKNKINFIFTLYPGGGFDTKDEIALKKLKTVLSSKYFKGVIVTQQFTEDFIVENYNCPKDKILNIFGCIIPQNSIGAVRSRRYNPSTTLQLCFCAAKYTEIGADKGYDIFIETAKILASKDHNIHFNVVGGYDSNVISIKGYENFFTFYGYKKYEELQPIFLEQDIILSPNRPYILNAGSFDGFPLGAVVEAVLNGAVPIVTDELNQNTMFSKDEIIIVKPDTEEIVTKIEELIYNPELLNLISKNAQKKFREIYSDSYQLNKRVDFIKNHVYDTSN
ncbi:glycosyltransferase family 4 protein [Chryseobacterium binzhouense]|uniref:glycosyltransferase family 4 protein n=1 Tax=Chryseobacterium binzhouense TaxID=2593646 RepID=UPI00289AB845|nr:glycosyltransferase family 4 protein [Chryseobacterium binzhouense]